MAVLPRAVTVRRKTEYELLLERHATRAQAAFFLSSRERDIDEVEHTHARHRESLALVARAVPRRWRRVTVERADLPRFLFEPEDLIIVVGQDGLVANTAKYLSEQAVLGVNPCPELYDGVLVRHPAQNVSDHLAAMLARTSTCERRTMARARLDDGRTLLALNEVFVGVRTHQSARYRIRFAGREEHQSSSGVIVNTGTGATGWARSIARERSSSLEPPAPTEGRLTFFVREAFPSVSTGTELTEGVLAADQQLEIVSELGEAGVIFGDGIEQDALVFDWGQTARIDIAPTVLNLVC